MCFVRVISFQPISWDNIVLPLRILSLNSYHHHLHPYYHHHHSHHNPYIITPTTTTATITLSSSPHHPYHQHHLHPNYHHHHHHHTTLSPQPTTTNTHRETNLEALRGVLQNAGQRLSPKSVAQSYSGLCAMASIHTEATSTPERVAVAACLGCLLPYLDTETLADYGQQTLFSL